jgi:BirA family transcriptional regulator, biotin operon repressor / biotin---[acetyl-CoA-carboxylase] ligase
MRMFDVNKFQALRTGQFGSELHFFDQVDSTNRVAADLARRSAAEGSVVLADHQAGGRGRESRTWYSPAGLNLYFTLVLYPPADRLHYLPFLTGLGVAQSLEAIGVSCDLKWPNDLLAQGKKIAGILIQTSVEENRLHFAIAGVGVNLNVPAFPPELEDIATSVRRITGKEVDREQMLAQILACFENLYGQLHIMKWDQLCDSVSRRSSYIQNCDVQIQQQAGLTTGRTAGLDSMGGLIVETENGREVFYAGEVSACRKK